MNKYKIEIPNNLLFEHVLEYIKQGKSVTIRVKGNSMRPVLRDGDRVLLKPFELKELKKGIIVLAKIKNGVILHRVVKFNDKSIWLAGDYNLVALEIVNYIDVVATVISLHRGEIEVKVNKRWRRMLGQTWYLIRPFRRIVKKLIKNVGIIEAL